MERRLAAIVSADIVGYSRLIDLDEAGTHNRVMALIEALKALVTRHGGRIVKTTGDGALVTFDSVVDAVECAIEAQRALSDDDADVPPARRLCLRIGVNLGDIIVDGGDVYGQGVNIAVRLQEVAKSGAVYISRGAVDQARGKFLARLQCEHSLQLDLRFGVATLIVQVDTFSEELLDLRRFIFFGVNCGR